MKQGYRNLRAVLVFAILAGAACTNTEQVFVAFPLFDDPPAGAAGFLGYSNQEANLPVCGNCHVGQNSEWQQTAHADAWAGLQASASAQGFCESCHSVSENGNAVEDPAVGWPGTFDPRYQDVQCESCHGPGLAHVTNPDASQPLASILAGTELTSGCGECHQGAHHGFVDEWSQSRHGTMNSYPQGREACQSCHTGQGALEAFGVKADYLEKGEPGAIPITCAVCHDPHDATNEHQLRFPVDSRNVEKNLCMKCHHKRAVPDLDAPQRGPHSPQGPLLLGEDVGWIPPNFQYADIQIRSTHGSEANPELCATCHVNSYEVTDAATGDFVWSVKGHSFKPIPCLDATGTPDPQADCGLGERTFSGCTASGCHGSQDAARSAYIVATTRMAGLVEELDALLDLVPASEFNSSDAVFTTAEGAKFNAGLGSITSSAIHNPFLTEALLTASISIVKSQYGLAPMSTISLENVFDQN